MKRNLNIQGLRAVLSLIVFAGHSIGAYLKIDENTYTSNPLDFLWDGNICVVIFFVLSGYFYYTTDLLTWNTYKNLIIKRTLKIAPPLLCVINNRCCVPEFLFCLLWC